MKKNCIGCLLTVLALLLTGCGAMYAPDHAFSDWGGQVHKDMAGAEDAWSYTLTAEPHSLNHYDEDGRLLVTGSYELPVMQVFHVDGTPYTQAAESLAPAVQTAQRVNAALEQRMKNWKSNFAEICTLAEQDSQTDSESWDNADYCYTDTVQAVFWNNSHIACITLRSESFTGGAHSIRSRSAVTFDMHTGKEITINDMVDDYAALRDAVALEILTEIADGKYVKYYDGELLFDDYRETIPEWMTRAVFFGEKSMTVVFGVYDIAAYAAGEQAFMIPYTLIAPYLNDYGKMVLEIE